MGTVDAAWTLDYDGFDQATEGVRESLCALGNGYVVTRGAAPEASAGGAHYPGTYVAGVFNRLRTRRHGHVDETESLVNLPNWLELRWRIASGPWIVPGTDAVVDLRQTLDLRAGVLHRRYRAVDSAGRATTVVSRCLVSMAAPHVAALDTTFIPENWSGLLHVRSGIDARTANTEVTADLPLGSRHLRAERAGGNGTAGVWVRMRTSQSQVIVGMAARTRVLTAGRIVEVPRRVTTAAARPHEDLAIRVEAGHPLTVEKIAAVYTSRDRAISEPATAARDEVARAGTFAALQAAHVDAWRDLWRRCHVELCADDGAESAARLNLHTFHVLQTASEHMRDLDAGVGARGLHGEGYRGHVFWDELFLHRVLVLHLPEVSRALLRYRHRRLDPARRAARAAGHRGAMFPWQSGSDGREETPTELYNPRSGQWMPDRSVHQRHVGLAIAYSAWQYYQATGDLAFMTTHGAELVCEIARFFADLAQENPATGRYEITGVMGPDEFHDGYPGTDTPGLANNAYTNVMTAWLLRRALELVALLRHHDGAAVLDRLGLTDGELARWADITTRMYVPFHGDGIISQFDGYADLTEFDLAGYRARYGNVGRLDLILAAEGDTPNRYQVSKQADVLMLFFLLSAEELREVLSGLGYAWPEEALPRTVNHYFSRVSHGSTLSRVVHAWVRTRTDRDCSWDCFTEALAADVLDTQGGTTREGIHLGAMAGTIDLAERCYLGLETRDDALWLNPVLPKEINRLRTTLTFRGHRLQVTATHTELTVIAAATDAAPVTVHAAGRELRLGDTGTEATVPTGPKSGHPATANSIRRGLIDGSHPQSARTEF
ncbi:glycosyl hydrolase family 65 protein [Lentzea sp. BCCO 10_0856]|uniref:Glycosyl hydrolase family 65 protein n=1 Tax=Lentzea miocenica TaxID=3095431 RepID=A0ABU4TA85_9PSEU|nr:glycosyl hydrolase family 65 protein [Lentzea sp. BCCO 10_0856]MDX8034842.1 glycosyl hydrolase family 65 protein [Lentzea sp. BCCO 10_0856]